MTEGLVERLTFRPDSDGEFDEIVANFADGGVHVETMSDQGCYVGFYWDDGRYCQWWITCTGRGKLQYQHDDGHDKPPKFPSGYGNDRIALLEAALADLLTYHDVPGPVDEPLKPLLAAARTALTLYEEGPSE